jgi:hypothetical protein
MKFENKVLIPKPESEQIEKTKPTSTVAPRPGMETMRDPESGKLGYCIDGKFVEKGDME